MNTTRLVIVIRTGIPVGPADASRAATIAMLRTLTDTNPETVARVEAWDGSIEVAAAGRRDWDDLAASWQSGAGHSAQAVCVGPLRTDETIPRLEPGDTLAEAVEPVDESPAALHVHVTAGSGVADAVTAACLAAWELTLRHPRRTARWIRGGCRVKFF